MAGALSGQLANLRLSSHQYQSCRGVCGTQSAFFRSPSPQQVFRRRTPLKVVAARVGGVEIPNNKVVEYSIQYIFGIGPTISKQIVAKTGLEAKRIRELSEEELGKLRDEIEHYTIEGDLRRFNAMNIRRLKEIQCYRGKRHIMNLPVRGQRTKTNSRTRKGKVKTVANKKK